MRYITLIALLLTSACGGRKEMVANPRDNAYYSGLVNSAKLESQAPQKFSEMKMIETGRDYPMRYVLFDNGNFYYQIDRLGNGYGAWNYEEGGIKLTATRPFFDMVLYVSARAKTGDDLVVRFVDRHGFNSVNAEPRLPAGLNADKPLDEFTESDKGL